MPENYLEYSPRLPFTEKIHTIDSFETLLAESAEPSEPLDGRFEVLKWKNPEVDVEAELNDQDVPIVEVGGPTPNGFDLIDGTKLNKQVYVSNLKDGLYTMAGVEAETGDHIIHKIGSVDFQADARELPIASESVAALIASNLPGRRSENGGANSGILREAIRTLQTGGFFVWQGARQDEVLNARVLGLEPVRASVRPAKGLGAEAASWNVVLQKTEATLPILDADLARELDSADLNPGIARDLVLIHLGLKPATLNVYYYDNVEPLEDPEEDERAQQQALDEYNASIRYLKRSGLQHSFVKESDDPSSPAFSSEEDHFVLVAGTKDDLEKMRKAYETGSNQLWGECSGFPQTAIDAYGAAFDAVEDKKSLGDEEYGEALAASIDIYCLTTEEIEALVPDVELRAFITFRLSRTNWQQELETVNRWQQATKITTPGLYDYLVEDERAWDEESKEDDV